MSHSLTPDVVRAFREIVYGYYGKQSRSLPWRKTTDPYRILVSEIMLQQTQVTRVIKKYVEFILVLPDFAALSNAPLRTVLSLWQGLGYNRRARALKETAEIIMKNWKGILPSDINVLMNFPGIGFATAGAIAAFAFNKPTVFIETNIRTVLIHHFFNDRDNVKDSELLLLADETLDRANPRTWYYALMDYGVALKKQHANPSRKSAHYRKQSRFKGSNRELRGKVIRAIVEHEILSMSQLVKEIDAARADIERVVIQLQQEALVKEEQDTYSIV